MYPKSECPKRPDKQQDLGLSLRNHSVRADVPYGSKVSYKDQFVFYFPKGKDKNTRRLIHYRDIFGD